MAHADAPAYPNDFLEPWTFSDVVLVVEDQKFHVHRSILAVWSPVFEKMFTSEFKEKNKDEIPLPGKKASEIKQLLYMLSMCCYISVLGLSTELNYLRPLKLSFFLK